MIYGGKTQAEMEADCGIGRLQFDTVLLGDHFESDDEDLDADLMAATPPTQKVHPGFWFSRCKTKKFRGYTRSMPHPRHPKMSQASSVFDWVFGRQSYWIPKDPIDNNNNIKARGRRHGPKLDDDIDDDYVDIGDIHDICPACGTSLHQAIDSAPFKSSLKLMYNDTESQAWLIGNKYILHEATDTHPDDVEVPLVEASRALYKLAPSVPTPRVRAGWKDSGKVIAITDTASTDEQKGERLYDIWWDLTPAERESVAVQVARHVSSWRESDLGRISNLTGGPVHAQTNLFGRHSTIDEKGEKVKEVGFGPFGSDTELWDSIESRLRAPRNGGSNIDEDTIALLRSRMPASSPCVLTHGDLSCANIIVARRRRRRGDSTSAINNNNNNDDGDDNVEVLTIQGFENAASLPVWAEGVALHLCYCEEDKLWKALLSRHLPPQMMCPAALDWWNLWRTVEDAVMATRDQTSSKAWGALKDRCSRWRETEIQGLPFWAVKLDSASEPIRRFNIRQAEDVAEAHVEELLRKAMESDICDDDDDDDDDAESLGGSSSWGGSIYDDDNNDDENVVAKPGLVPYHEIQQQHHALLASTTTAAAEPQGPPSHVIDAWRRDGRRKSLAVVEPSHDAIAQMTMMMRRHSVHPVWAGGGGSRAPSPPSSPPPLPSMSREEEQEKEREDELETPKPPWTKGLRPLSLPSIAMLASKATIAEEGDEDGGGEAGPSESSQQQQQQQQQLEQKRQSGDPRRRSILGNRAAPGQFYAALSAAHHHHARRHERSWSEDQTRFDEERAARVRARSLVQPKTPLFE